MRSRFYRGYFWALSQARRLYAPVTLGGRAIVVKNQQVLLVRLTYASGWFLPGGGVNRGESFRMATQRELREECGIHAEHLDFRGVCLNRYGHRLDHVAVFVTESFSGEPHVGDAREIAEVRFFSVQDLPVDLKPGHRRRIEEWRQGQSAAELW